MRSSSSVGLPLILYVALKDKELQHYGGGTSTDAREEEEANFIRNLSLHEVILEKWGGANPLPRKT